jgi:hypothetical protein
MVVPLISAAIEDIRRRDDAQALLLGGKAEVLEEKQDVHGT